MPQLQLRTIATPVYRAAVSSRPGIVIAAGFGYPVSQGHKFKMDAHPQRTFAISRILRAGILLLALQVATAAMAQEPGWYSNHECRMKFRIPAGWTARLLAPNKASDYKDTICTVRLQPRNITDLIHKDDQVDVYTIEIATVAEDFDHAAESGGFERRKDGWVVLGRTDIESPAHAIRSSRWRGLEGTATVGCFHEDGRGYAGLCDAPTAMINGGAQTSAMFDGKPQSSGEFDVILKSFQFLN